jgi:hypothetical protein
VTEPEVTRDGARLRAWLQEHPGQSWAFAELRYDDPLRLQVASCILSGQQGEPLVRLARFAGALEHRQRTLSLGTLQPAPEVGERRPHDVWIVAMTRMQDAQGPFFRVDVRAREGWSGYFDTKIPQDIERISKMRDKSQLLVIVGEVLDRPYECLVVFGGRTRLV